MENALDLADKMVEQADVLDGLGYLALALIATDDASEGHQHALIVFSQKLIESSDLLRSVASAIQ